MGVGGDDYVTKPFSPRELVARVHTVLRRSARATESAAPVRIVLGDDVLDLAGRRFLRGGTEIALTPTELDLLAVLAARPG